MGMYSLHTIAELIGGRLIGCGTNEISSISTDSRKITDAAETLFIAIAGERHNGHRFIGEMISKGISSFIVSDEKSIPTENDNCGFVLVENTIDSFQKLAAYHRSSFDIPVLAITGSNGKTIVKEWISQALDKKYRVTRSPKSYNSQIGVPLSVWLLNEHTEFGVFEAGISKTAEMERLGAVVQPQFGLFTNLGEAHQENFSSPVQKLREKLELFKHCEKIYYCMDHELVHHVICQKYPNTEKIAWSAHNSKASLYFPEMHIESRQTMVTAHFKEKNVQLSIPFTDKAGIENALQLVNFLNDQGFTFQEITDCLKNLQPVAMRLEQLNGIRNCIIINDSYNSDINSLQIALDYLNQQALAKKVLILSDIEQSGKDSSELYEQVAKLVKQSGINKFIGIGPGILCQQSAFRDGENYYFESIPDFIASGLINDFGNEAILIKGARSFRFETLVNLLAEKKHTTVLEINLNNLIHNLNYFRSQLKPGTGIMVMVKALAYGSGVNEIANLLQHEKVDYLGVAFTDEGMALRQAGITLPIMVMSPGNEDFERIIEYELEPEIYSLRTLQKFIDTAGSMQVSDYPVHLKIDTGMHRLGFLESEIEQVLELIGKTNCIHIKAVFSHLAASDDPRHDEFTRSQIATFQRVYAKVTQKLSYQPKRHILNSAGIERFPEAHFELVRLGIGLHGLSAKSGELLTVSSLKTHISQIKQIPRGDTIGYNRRGKANDPMTIAIIPVGYADGLDRKFGNSNGNVIVHNQAVPFVGDICMDMSMVDVTNLECNEGDEVIVFGPENPITKLASQIGTIPYEILTNVSSRVKRVYFKD